MAKNRHHKKPGGRPSNSTTKGSTPMPLPNAKKGIYTEYLDAQLDFNGLAKERKRQLAAISQLRGGRAVLVLAADINKGGRVPIGITYSDLVPFRDQLDVLDGDKIDVIVETPGGLGEVAEDMVKLLRSKFTEIGFIIPGCAKSAGTLLAMAGDEILMEPASALGPIDAQISYQGKQFSAEAFIKGLDKIKEEVMTSGTLNKAYIPILQAISPGEIQSAQNALDFAKKLVTDWLVQYKFRNWDSHSSTGNPVTPEDRLTRASAIADELANHSQWLTHGRSIKIEDLRRMRLLITDYSENDALAEAVRRYFVLLQLTFAAPQGVYKVFETPYSQILNFSQEVVLQQQPVGPPPQQADAANLLLDCPKCHSKAHLQANLSKGKPLQPGAVAFPANNRLKCPNCSHVFDLTQARQQIETQSGKKIV
jgi:ATP-dependent protease ClpP protease subunit